MNIVGRYFWGTLSREQQWPRQVICEVYRRGIITLWKHGGGKWVQLRVMRFLLTNDDGIDAPGMAALYRAAQGLGDRHVVAPAKVQSATSHAVTFHRELIAKPHQEGTLFEGIAVDGRPADCVKLGLNYLVDDVDVVLSGINAGANVGVNVTYSGTVGAAREAAMMGVPAIALSLHIGDPTKTDWDAAHRHVHDALEAVLAGPLEPGTLLCINVPILDDGRAPVGMCVAPLSSSPLVDAYDRADHDEGGHRFMASATMTFRQTTPGSDVERLFAGYITVTPLALDTTCPKRLDAWRDHM